MEILRRHLEFPLFHGVRDLGLATGYLDPLSERSLEELDRHGLVLCDATDLGRLDDALSLLVRHQGLTYWVDHHWTVDSLRLWVMACIEAFGTDWPVDRLYSSYADVVGAYVEIYGDEQSAVLA